MSAFLSGHPLYTDLSEGDQILWLRLERDFRYQSNVLRDTVKVRAGFECDGESVPHWLYSLVPPFGAARPGAIAHDGLYTFGGYTRDDGTFVAVTREQADAVYHELTVLNGMPHWRAWIRWKTLRATGWSAWSEHAKERAEGRAQSPWAATLLSQ